MTDRPQKRLIISRAFMEEFHQYSLQHLPNEVSCLLVGGRWTEGWFISGFVHVQVDFSNESSVANNWTSLLNKAQTWSPVGHVHTHPGIQPIVYPSRADWKFMKWIVTQFQTSFSTTPYFLIYTPSGRRLSAYQSGKGVRFEILREVPLPLIS